MLQRDAGAHATQAAEELPPKLGFAVPAGQSLQVVMSIAPNAAEKVPAGHGVQMSAAGPAYLPAPHVKHWKLLVAPPLLRYFPAGQASHDDWPLKAW